MERQFDSFMRQQKKDIVYATPPEHKFRALIDDGTLERVMDARTDGIDMSLRELLKPQRKESMALSEFQMRWDQ